MSLFAVCFWSLEVIFVGINETFRSYVRVFLNPVQNRGSLYNCPVCVRACSFMGWRTKAQTTMTLTGFDPAIAVCSTSRRSAVLCLRGTNCESVWNFFCAYVIATAFLFYRGDLPLLWFRHSAYWLQSDFFFSWRYNPRWGLYFTAL